MPWRRAYWSRERPLLRCSRGARVRDRAARGAAPTGAPGGLCRPGEGRRARLGTGPGDRRGPRRLGDLLRPAGKRKDDAGPDRRRRDRGSLRGAVGRLGLGRGRARGARPSQGAAGRGGTAHDSLPRRDPPVQQGTAGRAPAGGRVRPRHAYRSDDGEPVLRGQLGPPLTDAGLRAAAAGARGGGGHRPPRSREPRRLRPRASWST